MIWNDVTMEKSLIQMTMEDLGILYNGLVSVMLEACQSF